MINPKRGEIYYVYPQGVLDNDDNEVGTSRTDVKNGRPAIILGNDRGNKNSNMCVIAWLTRQDKAPLPEHVKVPDGPATGSTMLIEHPITVSQSRFGNFISMASDSLMEEVNAAILVGMGIRNTLTEAHDMLGQAPSVPDSSCVDKTGYINWLKEQLAIRTKQLEEVTARSEVNVSDFDVVQAQLDTVTEERNFLRHIVELSIPESNKCSK